MSGLPRGRRVEQVTANKSCSKFLFSKLCVHNVLSAGVHV